MKKQKAPQRHVNALKANDVTEVFVREFQLLEAELRSQHQWVLPTLDLMSAGRPFKPVETQHDVWEHAHIIDRAGHVAAYKMWARQGRVTYDVNEALAAELYRSTYDELPGNVFAHLPHINPLVVLPDPWPVRHGDVDGLVRGFYVYGYQDDPPQLAFTNDEIINALGLLFVIDLVAMDTGEVTGQTLIRLSVPTTLASFTFEDAVEFSADRVEGRYAVQNAQEQALVRELIKTLLRPALSLLIYLCCDNRDAVEVPVSKPVKRKASRASGRDPFFVEVGWRMGPKLHAARRLAGTDISGPGVPTGIRRAAHQRAGHFHKYRVGPGRPQDRTQTITRWVMPTWVGLGELPEDADPITTVVSVESQRRDPMRRRGLK